MKKILFTIVALLSFLTVNAQEYREAPYWFVSAKGGVSMPMEKGLRGIVYTAPSASVAIGRMLSPEVGFRINANKEFKKFGNAEVLVTDPTACFNKDKITIDVDGILNFSTLFGSKDYYPFNVYMLANLAHDHLGGGFMAEYNVARDWSISAETTLNTDRVWTAQLGVNFKFGKIKKKVEVVEEPEPVAEPVVEEPAPAPKQVEPAPEPEEPVVVEAEPEPAPVVNDGSLKENIFYSLGGTNVTDDAVIANIVEWCKKNKNKSITVSSYADKGTGTAAVNRRVARQRANKVAAKLRAKGISARRIRIKVYGDTVQPFPENDLNRVTIVEGK